jgi:hypothetical protein
MAEVICDACNWSKSDVVKVEKDQLTVTERDDVHYHDILRIITSSGNSYYFNCPSCVMINCPRCVNPSKKGLGKCYNVYRHVRIIGSVQQESNRK